MKYPKVNRSHIVPQCYLRNFADAQQSLSVRLLDSSREIVSSVKDVAVRRAYYSRQRLDGSRIDDIEWSLSHIEDMAAPILRSLDASWPLSFEDKRILAEFFAIQVLRGPRWHAGYEERTRDFIENWGKTEGFEDLAQAGGPTAEEVRQIIEDRFLSDTERLSRMLSLYPKGSSIFGSMIWALIQFGSPVLAASDHPVVGWPISVAAQDPQPFAFNETGLLNTLEFRVPISSTSALLMAWLNEEGDRPEPLKGSRHHARNLNAFTIANAERQWFHLPGRTPPVWEGRFLPLSSELLDGYDWRAARDSEIRRTLGNKVQKRLGGKFPREYEVVRLRRRPADPR
jgi:hypothetical protein